MNVCQQKLKQTALPTKPFLLTLAETLWASLNQNNMEDAENPLKSRQQSKTK